MAHLKTELLNTIGEQYSAIFDSGYIHYIKNGELQRISISKEETFLFDLYKMVEISPEEDIAHILDFYVDDDYLKCPCFPPPEYTVIISKINCSKNE